MSAVLSALLLSIALNAAASGAADCGPLDPAAAASLTWEAAVVRAGRCHPDVAAGRAALEGARADREAAGQSPNPQLTLGAGSINPGTGGLGSGSLWRKTFDHQLRVDQVVERGDKRHLRDVAGAARVQAARADLDELRRQAAATAARAFVDLRAADSRVELLRQTATLTEQSRQAVERRVRAGDAAPLELSRLSLEALRAQSDLQQAQADLKTQQIALAQLLGVVGQAGQLAPVSTPLPDTAPDTDVSQRPDVIAASARVSAARQALALAQAQRTRDLSVGVQLDRYPASSTNPSGSGNTISFSVSVPLFVAHAYEGEIGRAQADLVAAEAAEQRVRDAARADAERAQAQWRAADARDRQLSQQLMPAARAVADGAEFAYVRGATGLLDLLEARRALRAAALEAIQARAERDKALGDLLLLGRAPTE